MENEYYGIASTPMDDYLAHYGVRGMKWGVRKAVASGNSARLGRQYAKAQKKLAKLEKRAANANKYAKRAKALGVGAAVAGGLGAAGTKGIVTGMGHTVKGTRALGNTIMNASRGVRNQHLKNAMNKTGLAMINTAKAGGAMHDSAAKAARAMTAWGNSTSASDKARALLETKFRGSGSPLTKAASRAYGGLNGVSNNTLARIGAGAIGVGLAAGAAKNAYRAKTAQKKAAQFRSEMNKAFAGTQYANGGSSSKKRRRR